MICNFRHLIVEHLKNVNVLDTVASKLKFYKQNLRLRSNFHVVKLQQTNVISKASGKISLWYKVTKKKNICGY